MAYDKEKLIERSLKVIKSKKVVFIDELATYLPCNRATFYNLGLDKLDSIKDAIDDNKISKKARLRDKWEVGDNVTGHLALYKLLATPDELDRLTVNKNKNEHLGKDGAPLSIAPISWVSDKEKNGTGKDK